MRSRGSVDPDDLSADLAIPVGSSMNIEIPASIHEVLGLGVGNGRGALEWTREASRGPHLDQGILLGRQADIGNRPVVLRQGWQHDDLS